MDVPRLDPLPAFNFLITLLDTSTTFGALAGAAGLVMGGFSECTGLESTMETRQYLEGGVNDRVHQFPTRFSFTNIILKRGVGFGEDLWLWHQEFLDGKGKRRDGIIVLQNDLKVPIKVWTFSRGLPIKWTGPSLNAQASAVAIESIEIAHERLTLAASPGLFVDQLKSKIF